MGRTCLSIPIVSGDKISPWLYIVAPTISLRLRGLHCALSQLSWNFHSQLERTNNLQDTHTHIHKKNSNVISLHHDAYRLVPVSFQKNNYYIMQYIIRPLKPTAFFKKSKHSQVSRFPLHGSIVGSLFPPGIQHSPARVDHIQVGCLILGFRLCGSESYAPTVSCYYLMFIY